jgi:hypothetical protein
LGLSYGWYIGNAFIYKLRKSFFKTMTLIESIYEIKSAVLDLARYTPSKDAIVKKKVQEKYLKLIDMFFRENESLVKPEQRYSCLQDMNYFVRLMDEAVEHYYLEVEE